MDGAPGDFLDQVPLHTTRSDGFRHRNATTTNPTSATVIATLLIVCFQWSRSGKRDTETTKIPSAATTKAAYIIPTTESTGTNQRSGTTLSATAAPTAAPATWAEKPRPRVMGNVVRPTSPATSSMSLITSRLRVAKNPMAANGSIGTAWPAAAPP